MNQNESSDCLFEGLFIANSSDLPSKQGYSAVFLIEKPFCRHCSTVIFVKIPMIMLFEKNNFTLLEQLEKMGYIEIDAGVAREIRLTDKISEVIQIVSDIVRVPILGRIVASEPVPVPAADFNYYDADTSIEIAKSLLPPFEYNKQFFALEVQGDSMIDAMVNDGDFVIMEPISNNSEVHNGEMVAIWLPSQDETTLKYFYKEKEGYRLQPANPTMRTILVDKNEPLEVKGRAITVIRKLQSEIEYKIPSVTETFRENRDVIVFKLGNNSDVKL